MTVSEPDKSKIQKHVLTEEETYDNGTKLEECPKITWSGLVALQSGVTDAFESIVMKQNYSHIEVTAVPRIISF